MKINISSDFSPYPWFRYRKHGGKYSGEEFRDKFLIPALEKDSCVTIELDGTEGYGSSFLEEAFGGAVRAGHQLTPERLEFVSTDASVIKEIWKYINDAIKRKKSN